MLVTVTRSVVRMNGAPRMRQVDPRTPVMGKTPEQIGGYVFGVSPVSGRPVMQEVVEGLTQALNDEDRKARLSRAPRRVFASRLAKPN